MTVLSAAERSKTVKSYTGKYAMAKCNQPAGVDEKEPTDGEYIATFDPMFDLKERWGISMDEAEEFLESFGYFDNQRWKKPRGKSNGE